MSYITDYIADRYSDYLPYRGPSESEKPAPTFNNTKSVRGFTVQEAQTVAKVSLHVSDEAASLVYGAEYKDEECTGFVPVPWGTRRAAYRLLSTLAEHYFVRQEQDSAWFWPDVRALRDGRMTFEWITDDRRVIVYLPPAEEGEEERYVIVTNERGCKPNRAVEPVGTIHHRLVQSLCRCTEG